MSAALLPVVASADEPAQKALVALVGDAIRFNIGQDGFCGKRTEIEHPGNAQFRIPSQTKTYFFVRSTFRVPIGMYYCEGDYSFTPEPGKLHIIRYVFHDSLCRLEVFNSVPGGTPQPMSFEQEARRSCLLQ